MRVEPARMHVRVCGRVQGVGYRAYVRERAAVLGLAGWVRNADDGSVEVAAAGDAAGIGEFRAALAAGPAFARVVELRDLPACDVPPGAFTVVC